MYIIIETIKLNNVIKELAKLNIKSNLETNTVNNCVLIQADIFGKVNFTVHVNGLARTSITLEDIQVINPGECLVNLFLLSKKTKYIDDNFLELEYNVINKDEYELNVRTENISGKLIGPIFQLEEFATFDLPSLPICELSVNAFNNWTKTIKNFCNGLETLSIRVSNGYLESCTFNSLSHQTLLLYTRIASSNEYRDDFVINIPANALNTIPTLTNEVSEVRIEQCQGNLSGTDNTDEKVLKLVQNNIVWFTWTNLQPKADQLSVAEYCTNQPAKSKLTLDRNVLSNRLEYLINQPQNSNNKALVNLKLVSNHSDELKLELSLDNLDDVATVFVKQYEGNWYKQKYDAQKLISALKVLNISDISIEQFLTDTEDTANLSESLSLRVSDLQEQSRVEVYIESAY